MAAATTIAKQKKARINPWLIGGGAVIVLAIVGALVITNRTSAAARGRSTSQSTIPVTRGTITGSVSGSGTVTADQTLDLAFRANGFVQEVLAQEGDVVKKDQPLATLDARTLQAQVANAQAALDSAHARLKQAQQGKATPELLAASEAARRIRLGISELTMITVQNLTKTYQMGDVQVHALNGISFEISKGEFLAAAPMNGLAPSVQASGALVAAAADKQVSIVGTTPAYATLNNFTLQSGTFFDDAQARDGASVIVLGANVANDLFGSGNAVGQTVRLNGQPLRVIGVLEAKGGGGFGSVDDNAFMPMPYVQQRFANTRTADGNKYSVSNITLSVTNADDISGVQGRVAALLRERHKLVSAGTEDDFNILSQSAFLGTLTTITSLLTAFLAAVAGISLLVGGIGIMNIMLVSVTERTREIGLRKAVGARGQDILMQFLVEAVALSLTGGLLGLALGYLIATIVTLTGILQASVSPTSVALAVGFAVAVGLFFGIYPAQRAAKLNPIDALRYE